MKRFEIISWENKLKKKIFTSCEKCIFFLKRGSWNFVRNWKKKKRMAKGKFESNFVKSFVGFLIIYFLFLSNCNEKLIAWYFLLYFL